MAEETAVLDAPGTAAIVETPPAETLPENVADDTAPETEGEQAPETEAVPASPLAGKAAEEIEKIPEVEALLRDRLAREAESVRRKAEAAERQRADDLADADWDERSRIATVQNINSVVGRLSATMKKALDDGGDWDSVAPVVQAAVTQLATAGNVALNRDLPSFVSMWLDRDYPGAAIAPEAVRAFNDYRNRGMTEGMLTVALRVAADAAEERGIAEGRRLVAEEAAARAKGQAGTEKLKAAAAANGQRESATAIGGVGALSKDDPDKTLKEAHPLSKEYAAAYKRKYGFDL